MTSMPTMKDRDSEKTNAALLTVDRWGMVILLSLVVGNHREHAVPRLFAEVDHPAVGRPCQRGKIEPRVVVGRQPPCRAAADGHDPEVIFIVPVRREGDKLAVGGQMNVE